MFKSKTVFVIGAGASNDFGLPIGSTLRDQIQNLLGFVGERQPHSEGSDLIIRALQHRAGRDEQELTKYLDAARNIANTIGSFKSIDDFVNHHSGNAYIELVAKIAICWLILEAEAESTLLKDGLLDVEGMRQRDAWILECWELMRSGSHFKDPVTPFQNVSFIVFNYDRCVEVFLRTALVQMFDVDGKRAREIVGKVPIVHPYGAVSEQANFGHTGALMPEELIHLAQGIRTYGEAERDASKMGEIQRLLADAVNLVFVGFSFQEQNLEFFQANRTDNRPNVYSSGYEMQAEYQEDARLSLQTNLFAANTGHLGIMWTGFKGGPTIRYWAPRIRK